MSILTQMGMMRSHVLCWQPPMHRARIKQWKMTREEFARFMKECGLSERAKIKAWKRAERGEQNCYHIPIKLTD